MSPGSSPSSKWWRELGKHLPDPVEAILRHSHSGGLFEPQARLSFSQEGEDLVIARLFDGQVTGFYIDIGAHHPTRFSNTYLLYRRGWRGINVDPTPGGMRLFEKKRPEDINLEIAIARNPGTVLLREFDEPALNTTSSDIAFLRESRGISHTRTTPVEARRLADVLGDYIPPGTSRIDLLSVDTEGADLDVLESNDWDSYRPRLVVIEVLGSSLSVLESKQEIAYLRRLDYDLYAKLVNSVIMVDAH